MKISEYKLGAHLSTAQGYGKAIKDVKKLGGNCLQLFSGTPLRWLVKDVKDNDVKKFKESKTLNLVDNIYFHAVYLINLADDTETGDKSIKTLTSELNLAAKMQIKGSVVHTGSFKNKNIDKSIRSEKKYKNLIDNINSVLKFTSKDTTLILENSGTRKIGQHIEHLIEIIEDVANDRIKICLDTCHLHAAGYDLHNIKDFNHFFDNFEKKIGLNKLELIHLNDSRDEFGSLRDRHENIGEGKIALSVFENFLKNEKTRHLPFVLEVPGFDGHGTDLKNFDIVKNLINKNFS